MELKPRILFGDLPVWDGYGSGDGSGSGYGDGYGSGDGSGYWSLLFRAAVKTWTREQQDAMAQAEQNAAAIAFWKSTRAGGSANGGAMFEIAAPGLIQEVAGPLKLCSGRALHATLNPSKWKGGRLWVVALYGELAHDSDKIGALKREILGEVPLCQ